MGGRGETGWRVITSYSIHYTKLYERSRTFWLKLSHTLLMADTPMLTRSQSAWVE